MFSYVMCNALLNTHTNYTIVATLFINSRPLHTNCRPKYKDRVHYQINGDIDCGCICPSLNCLVRHCIDENAISKASECGSDFTSIEIACGKLFTTHHAHWYNIYVAKCLVLSHAEYDQAIAGEYGAGSRGVCVLHNNSQYAYNTAYNVHILVLLILTEIQCIYIPCTIIAV